MSAAPGPANLAAAEEKVRALLAAGETEKAATEVGTLLSTVGETAGVLRLAAGVEMARGDRDRMLGLLSRAAAAAPDDPAIQREYGTALGAAGRHGDAAAVFQRLLDRDPGDPEISVKLGRELRKHGDLSGARAVLERAVAADPENAEALIGLGLVGRAAGDFEAAQAAYERAVDAAPENPVAHYNLANALFSLARFGDAETHYRRSLDLRPDDRDTRRNYALCLRRLGRYDDSVALSDALIGEDPGDATARFNRGLTHLENGRYDLGCRDYAWRWKAGDFDGRWRYFSCPVWSGEPLDGRTLLVWQEQGVGDEIMFAGMIPDLLNAGAQLVLESDPRLMPLFARSFPAIDVFPRPDDLSRHNVTRPVELHAPAGDLMRWLTPDTGPPAPRAPYLTADPARAAACAGKYRDDGRPLVGIAWRSNNKVTGPWRSLPLDRWGPILNVPGVRFVSLQYGDTAAERAAAGVEIHHDPEIDQMRDLDGFAAQIAALDLIVAIDNSAVHFAGALGRPVWVMLPAAPDWRWTRGRDRGLWYADAALYRQEEMGDWTPVVAQVAAALSEWVDRR